MENSGFKHFISPLEPCYEMLSRSHLTTKLLTSMYDNVKGKVTGGLRRADLVALTTDCWSSRATQRYMTMTTNYIECALFRSAVKRTHCSYNKESLDGRYPIWLNSFCLRLVSNWVVETSYCYIYIVNNLIKFDNKALVLGTLQTNNGD